MGGALDINGCSVAETAMQELNADLVATLRAMPGLLFELDQNGEYINIWTHDPVVLAAQKAAFLGHTVNEMLSPEATVTVMSALAEAGEKGASNGQLIRLGLLDGDRWFELSISLKASADTSAGKRFIMLTHDITARKQAELEREQYFKFFNASSDLMCIADPNGGFKKINPAGPQMLGYSEEELLAKPFIEFIHPDDRQATVDEMARQLQRGFSLNFENRYLCKDGSFRWLSWKANVNYDEGLTYATARDITESKRLEQQLAEREDLFRAVFNQTPNAIELIDPETLCFVEVNPAACRILGYTREEYLSLRLVDTQADLDEEALLAAVQRVNASGEFVFENRHYCKNGDILNVEINARMLNLPGKRLLVGAWMDITERKRAEEKLAAREQEFRALAENSPDNIARYDCQARFLYANPTLESTLGRISAELMGKTPMEIAPGGLFEGYQQAILDVGATGESTRYEQIIPVVDGQPRIHAIRMVAEMGADGTPARVLAVGRDISEIKWAEENLRITASVFDNSQEAILITDANNVIIDVNPAFTRITGYSRDEALGRNPKLLGSNRQDDAFYMAMWQVLKQKKAWRGEIWNRRKSGEPYAELLSIAPICGEDGKVQRYVGVFSDISHIKEHEAELSRVAHYDALTGIPNRVLLADRMKQAIAQTSREQNMVAVCYLDLDGFKAINDSMGHEAGDLVLIEVARRIGGAIRSGDTVARLGGDEFVVLLRGLEKGEECVATLERLLATIAQPMAINNQFHTLSVSIGVSIYPLDDEDPDSLLRHADQAMYTAKQSGKNRFYIYDSALDLRVRNHHEFLKSMRYGLEHGQFELHYQPKINLRTKRLVGVEALLRWRHPERGLLAPAEFLCSVENTELDIEIGDWVVAAALAQIDRWWHVGLDIETSINISASHLEAPRFAEKLRQQLAHYPDIPPGRLQIEVLETVALNDVAIVRDIIETCREFGVGFALDDFGTGYSSLSYLSNLPVDVLKIDQSFVRDMLEDKGDKAIVQGIIALACAFGRQTVAEGIELEEHCRMLLDMGCEIGQGYYIARPMPADELANWQTG